MVQVHPGYPARVQGYDTSTTPSFLVTCATSVNVSGGVISTSATRARAIMSCSVWPGGSAPLGGLVAAFLGIKFFRYLAQESRNLFGVGIFGITAPAQITAGAV